MVAGLLGTYIRVEFLACAGFPDALEGAGVAVPVVLYRASAEVGEFIGRSVEAEAEAGEYLSLAAACELAFYIQGAVFVQSVDHLEAGIVRELVKSCDGAVFSLGSYALHGIGPVLEEEWESGAVVVVVGGTPEVGADAEVGIHDVFALVFVAEDVSGDLVEDQLGLFAAHYYAGVAVGDGEISRLRSK